MVTDGLCYTFYRSGRPYLLRRLGMRTPMHILRLVSLLVRASIQTLNSLSPTLVLYPFVCAAACALVPSLTISLLRGRLTVLCVEDGRTHAQVAVFTVGANGGLGNLLVLRPVSLCRVLSKCNQEYGELHSALSEHASS